MFALFPLPPTDHQMQQRRLRYEYGEDAMAARQRQRTRQPTDPRPATWVRLAMAAMLIRVGERLLSTQAGNPAVPGLETPVDPGTAPP
ncbi:MAG TPA: hypothetical protein VGR22_00725 [Thermomicrobiales bacterium]|nr:hypothetical protein [Thermomicrobiales bacterium]